jgi:glycine C-acetyltransferase
VSLEKIEKVLTQALDEFRARAILKSDEKIVVGIVHPRGRRGYRFLIEGFGRRQFLRMNSNSYLGLGLKKEVVQAAKKTAAMFGVGPGAGRSLSGTYDVHARLEAKLAAFHGKEAGMIFSSAYAAVMGTLFSLASPDTIVLSDELNHNCIINGIRLSKAKEKIVYDHNDPKELKAALEGCVGRCRRLIVITDGIFSMRGVPARLPDIVDLVEEFEPLFEEGILIIVDDSHGVGAFGETGRGTMEFTGEKRVDILVATLGKALGVNGGYAVSSRKVILYLKETAPFYVYSNCIGPSEASAAIKALDLLDGPRGRKLLRTLRTRTSYFREGLKNLGYEVIEGEHPIVPLMIRDTRRTIELVKFLEDHNIFVAGIFYPIVPKGEELIRLQVSADHTISDLNDVLRVLEKFKGEHYGMID